MSRWGTDEVRARSIQWHASPTIRPPPTSGSWVQWSRGMAPALTVATIESGPARPSSSPFASTASGAKRRLKPTITMPVDVAAASAISSSSASVSASGFSTKTCLPACSARSTNAAWVSWRVSAKTVSTAGSSKTTGDVGGGLLEAELGGRHRPAGAAAGRDRAEVGAVLQHGQERPDGEVAGPDHRDARPRRAAARRLRRCGRGPRRRPRHRGRGRSSTTPEARLVAAQQVVGVAGARRTRSGG